MKVKLNALMDTLFDVTGTDVYDGWAGGTCALWSENKQGHVICLTEDDPFIPFLNHVGDKVVDVDTFRIGVYGDKASYLSDGHLLDGYDSLVEVEVDRNLTALRAALRVAGAR